MPVTRVMLEYVHPWPNHAGPFLARRGGGFIRAGLDVNLISGGYDRGGVPEILVRGEYDITSLRLSHALQSWSTGTPFIAVVILNQRQLGSIITTPETGITRFAGLEDKTVTVPLVAHLIHGMRGVVAADGADPALMRFAGPSDQEPDVRSVEQGLYDAAMNVRAWEPFQGNTPLDEVVVLEFDLVGVASHHSYSLSARQDTLDRSPNFVRSFLAAAANDCHGAMKNEDGAVEAMSQPICHVRPDVLRASLRAIRDSWFTPEGRQDKIQENLVASYAAQMDEGGWLEDGSRIEDPEGAWTSNLLP